MPHFRRSLPAAAGNCLEQRNGLAAGRRPRAPRRPRLCTRGRGRSRNETPSRRSVDRVRRAPSTVPPRTEPGRATRRRRWPLLWSCWYHRDGLGGGERDEYQQRAPAAQRRSVVLPRRGGVDLDDSGEPNDAPYDENPSTVRAVAADGVQSGDATGEPKPVGAAAGQEVRSCCGSCIRTASTSRRRPRPANRWWTCRDGSARASASNGEASLHPLGARLNLPDVL